MYEAIIPHKTALKKKNVVGKIHFWEFTEDFLLSSTKLLSNIITIVQIIFDQLLQFILFLYYFESILEIL